MSKVLSFGFGLACYLAALATVVYTIGFEENLLVPKGVDAGAAGPLVTAVIVNVMVLAIFVAQHTVMARPAFKARLTRVVPQHLERSVFVLAATAAVVLILWQWRPIPGEIWNLEGSVLGQVLLAVNFIGWAVFLWSTFLIDHFELFGVRQVWNNLRGTAPPDMAFKTPALYKLCRHPMMLGFIIAFWATPQMSASHLFFSAAVTVYIFIGIWFEERDLIVALGARYEAYRRQVPMILPFGGKRGSQPDATE